MDEVGCFDHPKHHQREVTWSIHNGQREASSVVQTLEVAVEVLMRSDHQQFDSL